MPSALDSEVVEQAAPVVADASWYEQYSIIKQEVELEVNFRDKSVSGVSHIQIFPLNQIDEITLDARQCEIDVENVTVNGKKVRATFSDPYDLMKAPPQWQLGVGQYRTLRKRMMPSLYEKSTEDDTKHEAPINDRDRLGIGCVPADRSVKIAVRPEPPEGAAVKDETDKPDKPGQLKLKITKADKDTATDSDLIRVSIPFKSMRIRDGLHFVGVDEGDSRYPHVYTRHSIGTGTASCIFPCVDDPGSRHPWKISIKCPRTLGDAFEQPLATQLVAPTATASRKRKLGEAAPAAPQLSVTPMQEEDKLKELTVVCSGNLSGEQIDPKDEKKKIMTFECQNSAAQHISFAVGPFDHADLSAEFRTEEADEKLGSNAAKVHVYFLPGRFDQIMHTCAPIVAAADYFAPEFGKYPYESYKMCFVDDMVSDTAAATSMTLCSNRLIYEEDIIDPEIEVTRTLVHALASQYLGVHIVPNTPKDSWLVIGIQWFMTDLFMRTLCGNNWYRFHLKTMADKLVEADVQRPSLRDLGDHLHIGDFELEFMSLKAPLVLFILDQRMSKIPGSTGVVRVVSNMVSNANIHNTDAAFTCASDMEFKRNCEKRSQYRPDELWSQWVERSGCPRLSITQKFNKKNLNVDIMIKQTQATPKPRPITKEEFWRELQEDIHHVYAAEVPKLFTGPFTVRIHEADGTPYEHYQQITDKDRSGTQLSISYNTKYKRLKRTKKAQASANTSSDKHDVQDDDVVYYNMLGDVLTTDKDIRDWGLQDWSKDVQVAMDQESYEWIRYDCNFEWICETITDMPGYMYLAQLQQDRDVVAHQDAMLFFKRGKRHGVAATVETRTVMDRRYYPGIRTMAAEDLAKQADPDLNYIGLAQLVLSFRHFFCDRVAGKGGITFPPSPNDFHDKAQYALQMALPGAIARTRERGRCSKDGRNFLLDLLLFNDNSENEYRDDFYIASLLEALTTSLIPEKMDRDKVLLSSLDEYDEDDVEFKRFILKTLEEIDKYRRMDEWTHSYQNVWTITALNCKMRLMKERVIPLSPLEFVQYLQDMNLDRVRIKAFECLVELGLLSKTPILKLLFSHLSTDRSPFVRDRLFKILCRGIASIALGENQFSQREPVVEVDESGLIVDQGDAEIQQRKLDAVRKEDITHALHALKEELKGNSELATVIWNAVESSVIGFKEKCQLLDLCSAMFEAEDSLLVTLNYPKYWTASRVTEEPTTAPVIGQRSHQKPRVMVKFTQHLRTQPLKKLEIEPLQEVVPLPADIKPEPKKIKLSTKPSFSGPSTSGLSMGGPSNSRPPTPSPLVRQDSISVTAARQTPAASTPQPAVPSASDSISVMRPVARPSPPVVASPQPTPSSSRPNQPANGSAKPLEKKPKMQKKRKSDEGEGSERPKKIIKTENGTGRRRIVKVPFRSWHKLPQRIRDAIQDEQRIRAASSTIVATPVTKRPGFSTPVSASSPRSAVSPAPPARSSGPQPSTGGPSSAQPGVKQRKPLPSSAPHPGPPAPAAAPLGGASSTPAPVKKMIKLKIKMQSQGK
ncbi:hypothetical protein QBC34DRAFT_202509 [Podospora aff. communis PSN243]|uniref:Transcription initiation factor TFIID subunit 2 n=1 Tax=Podospora aff. communis PSN243 TaxID=3040156 RepID=A0AAV9H021_9PEZI|nr:hypothetical protein QBC34DRAFT_202509 [Podospora aff. communis PSN243]